MSRYFIAYIATGVVFVALDFAYLASFGISMFRNALGSQLADPMRVGPGAAFYLLFVAGLVFFAVAPAFADAGLGSALLRGAALGLVAYATYELTNYSTLASWSLRLVIVDTAWGTIASAIAAAAGYWAAARLGG